MLIELKCCSILSERGIRYYMSKKVKDCTSKIMNIHLTIQILYQTQMNNFTWDFSYLSPDLSSCLHVHFSHTVRMFLLPDGSTWRKVTARIPLSSSHMGFRRRYEDQEIPAKPSTCGNRMWMLLARDANSNSRGIFVGKFCSFYKIRYVL